MTKAAIKRFKQDRNQALLSLDKDQILTFMRKYQIPEPSSDTVFWAGVHKGIVNMKAATEEQRHRSYSWLIEHGFSGEINS
jgi:hypothetical protein